MVPKFAPPLTRRAGLRPAGAAVSADVRTRPAADVHEVLHQQVVAGSQHSSQQPQQQDEVETHTDLRSVIIPYLRASISADRVLHPHAPSQRFRNEKLDVERTALALWE